MNWLLIDAGNSRTLVLRAAVADGHLVEPVVVMVDGPTPRTDAETRALVGRIVAVRDDDEPVAIVSVIPRVTSALMSSVPRLHCADHSWEFPFALAIEQAETVGADRWCNVAAAVAAGLRHALVVDAGTATTIDVLADGAFVGGLIAPGMAFAARQLQDRAARLWPVPFERCALKPGRHTAEALQVGGYHVGVHGVVGTVEALQQQYPEARVLVTGGLASYLDQPGWRLDALLTFRGLAFLLPG